MKVIINNYQIKPYYDYCYRLAKRKGKKQWRTLGYYDHLSQATEVMLGHYARTSSETLNLGVDIISVKKEVDRIVNAIHNFSNEIKEAINNEQERIKNEIKN